VVAGARYGTYFRPHENSTALTWCPWQDERLRSRKILPILGLAERRGSSDASVQFRNRSTLSLCLRLHTRCRINGFQLSSDLLPQ
jgi:hypothetical protein